MTYLARAGACDPESWDDNLPFGACRATLAAGCGEEVAGWRYAVSISVRQTAAPLLSPARRVPFNFSFRLRPLHEVLWTREQRR